MKFDLNLKWLRGRDELPFGKFKTVRTEGLWVMSHKAGVISY
ncbi:MAG: hypothetical protein ACYDDB_07120 [bacterium]